MPKKIHPTSFQTFICLHICTWVVDQFIAYDIHSFQIGQEIMGIRQCIIPAITIKISQWHTTISKTDKKITANE